MLPQQFAYDTETDRSLTIPDRFWRHRDAASEELQKLSIESTQTVLVQVCDIYASDISDVILFEGEDALRQFVREFEVTTYDTECHAFNLGKYEYSWLKNVLFDCGYVFQEKPRRDSQIEPGHFTIFADNQSVYQMKIRSPLGHLMTVSDDKKRLAGESMKHCAEMIRKKHPDWFAGVKDVKLDVEEYNNGWFYQRNGYDDFIAYSRQDAFSQALIARYVVISEMGNFMTAQGWAMHEMLLKKYGHDPRDPMAARYSKLAFRKEYPPLDRDMQDLVEHNLLGGFVWGKVGDFHGHFCHGDYKSSYPYEYAYGRMFWGRVCRATEEGSDEWQRALLPRFKHWVIVSFDFDLKSTGIASITGAQVGSVSQHSKKVIAGHVDGILLDEVLFEEISESYDLDNVVIHEVWYAKRCTGGFEETTEMFFRQKEEAAKHTLEKTLAKLCLNGAQHGKTITKTNRRSRMVNNETRDDYYVMNVNEPQYNALIGFTGMQLARARLLKECRMLKEAGYEVYMCDTDSFVTDALPEEAEAVIGPDRFIHENGDSDMKDTLGKIEWETDDEGNKVFDHFKCWGLKMYLEENEGKYRKSAFKGMHDDVQMAMLPNALTDGTEYSYIQNTLQHIPGRGVTIAPLVKSFHAESVWFEDDNTIEQKIAQIRDECWTRVGRTVKMHGCREDIKAYLRDVHEEEEDRYWYTHPEKDYIQKKWEDYRDGIE